MKRMLVGAVLLLSAISVFGQRVDSRFSREAIGQKKYPPPPRLALQVQIAPAAALSAVEESAPEIVQSIREWNDEGRIPAKNGFVRSTVDPIAVFLDGSAVMKTQAAAQGRGYVAATATSVAWSGSVQVKHAFELRLHLEQVVLPAGAVLWVYGNDGAATAFDGDLIDDHRTLWTPTVDGDTIHLEVEIPRQGGPASFVIRELAQIIPDAFTPKNLDSSCLIDAACISTATMPQINGMHAAVAHLRYIEGSSAFVCSGGLLNDRAGDSILYLLTANHCFSDQAAASSLEAYWDYIRATCNGPIPPRSSFPKSTGSTLLATSANSDFTFVRLNSAPAGRFFLGWDAGTTGLSTGQTLYRVSHPFPDDYTTPLPQAYSTTTLDFSSPTCSDTPRPRFLYSHLSQGSTWGGSSGSPVVYLGSSSTYVVGQLYGKCYPTGAGDCDSRNQNIDGAFSQTYNSVTTWLEAGNPAQPTPCVQDSKTACVLSGRFKVTVRYRGAFDNGAADTDALVKQVSGFANPSYETAFFYFNDSNNIEMLVKLLDQGNTNSSGQKTIAVLFGTATPLRIEMTITDTTNGASQQYTSAFGAMTGKTDFTAFVK